MGSEWTGHEGGDGGMPARRDTAREWRYTPTAVLWWHGFTIITAFIMGPVRGSDISVVLGLGGKLEINGVFFSSGTGRTLKYGSAK
jgi:hypothetical protein